MQYSYVQIGDVISLGAFECGDIPRGEYVVEDARDSGGWMILARKLDTTGKYCPDNPMIQFHQCPGYENTLLQVKIIGYMRRIFV